MQKKNKIIIEKLKEMYPDAKCELNYETPFQLLVATVLSAQTTDKKVNEVTKELFKDYPDAESFANLTQEMLEDKIRVIGLYRNKAKNLVLLAEKIRNDFGGEVPETMEGITSLPGAGRKTANVVLSNAFGIPSIAVDTHVFRVSNRIGLANSDDVYDVEMQLQKKIKKSEWTLMHHVLIFHGRRCCTAKNPKCDDCGIKEYCKYFKKTRK